MSFGREKRRLLGWLALVAPVPLPFNEVIGWPSLLLYWTAVGWLLLRSADPAAAWLPNWAMNLLALAYLPFLFLDFSLLWRGRVLQPLLHLAMFAVAVKLFGLRREKDKWQVLFGIFFIFVAAMGTSVHPTVVVFLGVFLVLGLLTLTRFAAYHALDQGPSARPATAVPLTGFLWLVTPLTLLVAVPLFAMLPRLQAPYVVAPGGSGVAAARVSSFLEGISLDSIGRARSSREVVMRLAYDNRPTGGQELRFKAASFDLFRGDSWRHSTLPPQQLRRAADGFFQLAPDRPRSWVDVWLQPIGSTNLALPLEAAALDLAVPRLLSEETGVVSLVYRDQGILQYRVGLAASRQLPTGASTAGRAAALDLEGVTPRMGELAAQVMGEGPPAVRARRLEEYFVQEFEYSLDFVGSAGTTRLDDFLFRHRRGHCEYFASAMVLMLRAAGIPARLTTGFYGAEYNPIEGYFIVRQNNAHAWVEALVDEDVWQLFDPTPPSGRPANLRSGIGQLMSQTWDYLLFRWDRYVLTYGFFDQAEVFIRLRALWRGLWDDLLPKDGNEPAESTPTASDGRPPTPAAEGGRPRPGPVGLGAIALLLTLTAWLLWRLRPPLTARRAYDRLRRRLAGGGRPPVWQAPLTVAGEIERRFPAAAEPAARLVERYLRESFGGEPLGDDERPGVEADLKLALSLLR